MTELFALLGVREAVASVALSHRADCDCRTCRAAAGDAEAMFEILADVAKVRESRE